jgi:hypothetical protein
MGMRADMRRENHTLQRDREVVKETDDLESLVVVDF